MFHSPNLRGIIVMVFAMGAFIAGDSASKLAMARVPMFEVMLIRASVAVLLGFAVVVIMGHLADLLKAFRPLLLARGFCETAANFGFTLALPFMAIADLTSIFLTTPLIIILGAWWFFGEALGLQRLGLIALGLTGALLVAQPGGTAASIFAGIAFLGAVCEAGRDLITRKVPGHVPAPVAAFAVVLCLFAGAAVAFVLSGEAVLPSAGDAALSVFAGSMMVVGQLGVFLAFRWGEARSVAPFMYAATVWAILSGFFVFAEVPNALAVAGMLLVVLAGLLVMYVDARGNRTSG